MEIKPVQKNFGNGSEAKKYGLLAAYFFKITIPPKLIGGIFY